LYICPPRLYTVATVPWEIHKVTFQQYYSYILQIIYVISEENKLLPRYPPHLRNVTPFTLAGALAFQRNFHRCKINFVSKCCILVYWQRYRTALEQQASAKLCGVYQTAPTIFDRVAILLGIGPHSIVVYYAVILVYGLVI